MATPGWAIKMVEDVAFLSDREPPALTWRRSSYHTLSSGRFYTEEGRIVVTAGKDRTDQKLTLLHELAHWLTPDENHGPRFWDKAWEFYRLYNLPVNSTLKREGAYKAEAIAAARRAGIRVSERRAKAIARTRPHSHKWAFVREANGMRLYKCKCTASRGEFIG